MFLQHSPLQVLLKRWKFIFLIGLVVAVLAAGVSLLFPLEYRADAQVLIMSQLRGADPYTAAKSAERVGENLVQIIKTNDFYNKVMQQPGFELDKSKFVNVSERAKRKNWQKTVSASVVYGTGVLNVSAYHTSPAQAMQYAAATAAVLTGQGWQYTGNDVIIKVVNDPVATSWPMRPNIVLNAILGLVLGMLVGGMLVVRKG
jgi:capsular polysaccharide biosynthesis protein